MNELEFDQQIKEAVRGRVCRQVRLSGSRLEQDCDEVLPVIALLELCERVDRIFLALLNPGNYLLANLRAAAHGLPAAVLEPILIFRHDDCLEQVRKLLLEWLIAL